MKSVVVWSWKSVVWCGHATTVCTARPPQRHTEPKDLFTFFGLIIMVTHRVSSSLLPWARKRSTGFSTPLVTFSRNHFRYLQFWLSMRALCWDWLIKTTHINRKSHQWVSSSNDSKHQITICHKNCSSVISTQIKVKRSHIRRAHRRLQTQPKMKRLILL